MFLFTSVQERWQLEQGVGPADIAASRSVQHAVAKDDFGIEEPPGEVHREVAQRRRSEEQVRVGGRERRPDEAAERGAARGRGGIEEETERRFETVEAFRSQLIPGDLLPTFIVGHLIILWNLFKACLHVLLISYPKIPDQKKI